jgi:hypothetical protein
MVKATGFWGFKNSFSNVRDNRRSLFHKTPPAYRDLTIRIPDYADLSVVSRKPPRRREPRLGQALPELLAGRHS